MTWAISHMQAFKKIDTTKRGYVMTSEIGKFYCPQEFYFIAPPSSGRKLSLLSLFVPFMCVHVQLILWCISHLQAFKKIDTTKRGYVTTSEIGKFYCAYKHPQVRAGMMLMHEYFWAHLCQMHGGLLCIAFCLFVCLSVTRQKLLDNNSYLGKYCTYGHETWSGHGYGCPSKVKVVR